MGLSMQPYGIQAMLKEGHKLLSGLDEAVLNNIDACRQLSSIARTFLGPNVTGEELFSNVFRLDQYAIPKFAESFEMVPKTLSENAGLNAMEIISSLYAEHASGMPKWALTWTWDPVRIYHL